MSKRILVAVWALASAFGLMITPACQTVAPQKAAGTAASPAKPVIGKVCTNCHQPQAGSLRGKFENVAFKSRSIQIKIDKAVEIVKFDPKTIKVVDAGKPADAEALRGIKKGHEVRIAYTEKDGVRTATEVVSKPPIKVPAEKLMTTAEVEKLVAVGPGKGKYTLIDARPRPKFQEGAIPTAVNIPFPAFDKMAGKLPADKNALIVYYCAGMT